MLFCGGAVGISGGEWSANWQVTRSTKCAYLLSRLRVIGAAPPPQPAAIPSFHAPAPATGVCLIQSCTCSDARSSEHHRRLGASHSVRMYRNGTSSWVAPLTCLMFSGAVTGASSPEAAAMRSRDASRETSTAADGGIVAGAAFSVAAAAAAGADGGVTVDASLAAFTDANGQQQPIKVSRE